MSDLVDPQDIEEIVGVKRHEFLHYARAVSSEGVVYILHSQRCVDTYADLRHCPFSMALDNGIEMEYWIAHMDEPVEVGVFAE